MSLKNLGEFGFIDEIKNLFKNQTLYGAEGIGDDCAIIPINEHESYVVTSDMLVESRHFLLNNISAYELGYKSLAVNISDVASMGATPLFSFLCVAFSEDIDETWSQNFIKGYKELSQKHSVALLGGDTTAAPKGGVSISVTAVGKVKNSCIKRRSGAKEGDYIVLTGNIGDSALGLKLILENCTKENGSLKPILENSVADSEFAYLRNKHYLPEPAIKEGEFLGQECGVHAMMDVSDGISSDLGHICRASNVGATVNVDQLPIEDKSRELCAIKGWDMTNIALSGGEDYTLLCTIDKSMFDAINQRFTQKFSKKLHVIGEINNLFEINFTNDKGEEFKPSDGFTHF